jgi:hypothetical protein
MTRLAAVLGRSGWRFDDLRPGQPAWHTKASCSRPGPVLFFPDDRRGVEKQNQVIRATHRAALSSATST